MKELTFLIALAVFAILYYPIRRIVFNYMNGLYNHSEIKEINKTDGKGGVYVPMPCHILKFTKENGETVQEGEEIAFLEAMKMQITIRSPKSGYIFYRKNAHENADTDELLAVVSDYAYDIST